MKLKINQLHSLFLLAFFMLGGGILFAQSADLVVVDNSFAQKEVLFDKLPSDATILQIDTNANPWKVIREKLEKNRNLKNIHLFAEFGFNSLLLGGTEYTKTRVENEDELAMLEGLYSGDNYQLLLYTCNLPSNQDGIELINLLGQKTYFNVAASTNCTSIYEPAFTFDYTTLNMPTTNSIIEN